MLSDVAAPTANKSELAGALRKNLKVVVMCSKKGSGLWLVLAGRWQAAPPMESGETAAQVNLGRL